MLRKAILYVKLWMLREAILSTNTVCQAFSNACYRISTVTESAQPQRTVGVTDGEGVEGWKNEGAGGEGLGWGNGGGGMWCGVLTRGMDQGPETVGG